tara:strand:+ start:170 stop:1093 length:924 start_codon:yes stop_codon:yes gene_type:complete
MKKFILFLLFISSVSFGQYDIEINYTQNQDNSVSFNYLKSIPGTVFLVMDFENLSNTNQIMRQVKALKNSSGLVVKLKPTNNEEQIGFRYSYKYYRGNINSKIDRNYPYILPFKKNAKVAPLELYSIQNVYMKTKLPNGWKSYSFSFDSPQIVKGIRKGIVVDIKSSFDIDTTREKDYYSAQNSIEVEHKDGTVAVYQGFDKNQIYVSIGETIYPQTKLGELSKFDSRNLYRLYLSVICYKTIKEKNIRSIESIDDYEIAYITPKFFQNNKIIQVESNTDYLVQFDEKTLFKEMRKREIKKFKKLSK